jgi:hypothetical protein
MVEWPIPTIPAESEASGQSFLFPRNAQLCVLNHSLLIWHTWPFYSKDADVAVVMDTGTCAILRLPLVTKVVPQVIASRVEPQSCIFPVRLSPNSIKGNFFLSCNGAFTIHNVKPLRRWSAYGTMFGTSRKRCVLESLWMRRLCYMAQYIEYVGKFSREESAYGRHTSTDCCDCYLS